MPDAVYRLNAVEIERLHSFTDIHRECRSAAADWPAIVRLDVTHTGVGAVTRATCEICKATVDITDMESW